MKLEEESRPFSPGAWSFSVSYEETQPKQSRVRRTGQITVRYGKLGGLDKLGPSDVK